MVYTFVILLSQADPVSATLDWVISRGLVGGALLLIFILGMVVKNLHKDNSALRDRVEKMLEKHKNEVKAMANQTLAKVESMQEKQTDLVEKVVEVQADTNSTLRSLRVVDR